MCFSYWTSRFPWWATRFSHRTAGLKRGAARLGDGAVRLAGRATRTLPAAVYNVLTFEQLAWGPLAAAAIVVTLPVLLLTIFIQKEIVAGLTHGGVKGA